MRVVINMKRTIALNGSVQKDLTKIIQAISEFKYAYPSKSVSLTFSSKEDLPTLLHTNQAVEYQTNGFKAADLAKDKPETKTAAIFLAGTGTVGSEILRQLAQNTFEAFTPFVFGICNSKKATWNTGNLEIKQVMELYKDADLNEVNWDEISANIIDYKAGPKIFIDATGSRKVSENYERLLENNVSVVTANKIANSADLNRFQKLNKLSNGPAYYKYETTAGAGLPLISTIRNLKKTGDSINSVSGVLSGTMTYIFEALQNGVSFSEAVRNAAENGYSEPDPRDDLSGEDVVRKFLILSRVAGFSTGREDVTADNQTPESLRDVPLKIFWEKLPEYDSFWKEKTAIAKRNGQVLRYVGELSGGRINVGVRAVSAESPLGNLRGTDNQVAISTRYYKSPIIIQGPGAGKEVTAQGVISEVIEIADKF